MIATGVEFVSGGQHFFAHVTKEVIISAGAVQTPQLLELSGIGNASILSAHNITTLVDLPGVGENLQVRHRDRIWGRRCRTDHM